MESKLISNSSVQLFSAWCTRLYSSYKVHQVHQARITGEFGLHQWLKHAGPPRLIPDYYPIDEFIILEVYILYKYLILIHFLQ